MSLNIELIRESFGVMKPHAVDVVNHFYNELFDRHPEARDFFDGSFEHQSKVLISSLTHVVDYLEEPDHLKQYLRKFGAKHFSHSLEDEHYAWVVEAVLTTFAYYFDEQWTEELNQNWIEVFSFIATEIQTGTATVKKKDIEMQNKKDGPKKNTLPEVAHNFAQELFKRAVDEIVNSPEFKNEIQKKARELLTEAVEEEAKQMLSVDTKYAKSA